MLQAKEKEKKQDLHFFFPIVLLEESYDKSLTFWNKGKNEKKNTHTHTIPNRKVASYNCYSFFPSAFFLS